MMLTKVGDLSELRKAMLYLSLGAALAAVVMQGKTSPPHFDMATPMPGSAKDLLGNGPGGGSPFAIKAIQATNDMELTKKTVEAYRAKFADVEPGKVYGIEPFGPDVANNYANFAKGVVVKPGLNMEVLMPDGRLMHYNTVYITLQPGFSFGVHAHPFDGMACVSGGQFRLWFEDPFGAGQEESGPEGVLRKGGHCYSFPANTKMWLTNDGDTPVTTHDQMLVPPEWGTQYFVMIEPKNLPFWQGPAGQF